MNWLSKRLCLASLVTVVLAPSILAQKALTWQEVRDKFEAAMKKFDLRKEEYFDVYQRSGADARR